MALLPDLGYVSFYETSTVSGPKTVTVQSTPSALGSRTKVLMESLSEGEPGQ